MKLSGSPEFWVVGYDGVQYVCCEKPPIRSLLHEADGGGASQSGMPLVDLPRE